MYSYHIVAKLRQFRGAAHATNRRRPQGMPQSAGTVCCRSGLTGMEKFCLAVMVSAVLLLIVASDLLVNGPGMQESSINVANLTPVSSRLVR